MASRGRILGIERALICGLLIVPGGSCGPGSPPADPPLPDAEAVRQSLSTSDRAFNRATQGSPTLASASVPLAAQNADVQGAWSAETYIMKAGAEQAGRAVPPLIAHAPVCVHENAEEVRAAVRQQIMNVRMPFYQRMLVQAGYPEASQGTWSDAMIDAVVFWGDETRVAERIREMFSFGAAEVLVSPIGAGEDQTESVHRATRLLAELAKSPA